MPRASVLVLRVLGSTLRTLPGSRVAARHCAGSAGDSCRRSSGPFSCPGEVPTSSEPIRQQDGTDVHAMPPRYTRTNGKYVWEHAI